VEVRNGIVVLRGLVDDVLDAEAAEAVAARVDGVREVREELELRNG
jgi:osmotically-inducible protein OsmY